MDATTPLGIALVLAVVAGMALAATLLLRAVGAGTRFEPLIAIARAAVQLALLALVLRFVFASIWLVAAWLCVMLAVAVITSARRIGWSREALAAAAAAISLAAAATLAVVMATGVIGLGTQYVLAFGGVIIGNVMSVTSVAAKRLREHLLDSRDEIEGMLALGATPRRAAARFRGAAIGHALIPTLDSTATTGLVTLPGAFVGAIFAGADPVEAGLFQVVVLGGIIFGGAIAATVAAQILGAPTTLPTPAREAAERDAA